MLAASCWSSTAARITLTAQMLTSPAPIRRGFFYRRLRGAYSCISISGSPTATSRMPVRLPSPSSTIGPRYQVASPLRTSTEPVRESRLVHSKPSGPASRIFLSRTAWLGIKRIRTTPPFTVGVITSRQVGEPASDHEAAIDGEALPFEGESGIDFNQVGGSTLPYTDIEALKAFSAELCKESSSPCLCPPCSPRLLTQRMGRSHATGYWRSEDWQIAPLLVPRRR